jgi:hypothetical protein
MAKAKGGGKLHRLPFTTFGEIAALGFEIEVHCSCCYRQSKVDPANRRLNDRVFAAAPFRCGGMRDRGFAVPLQPCGAPGFVYIRPAVRLPVGGEVTLIFLSCPRCVPPWFIEHRPSDRPPRLRAATTDIVARPAEAGSNGVSTGRLGGRRIRGPRSRRALHHGKVKPELFHKRTNHEGHSFRTHSIVQSVL